MSDKIMALINSRAAEASEDREQLVDLPTLAAELAEYSTDYTTEEIEQKLMDVWRSRGLSWKTE